MIGFKDLFIVIIIIPKICILNNKKIHFNNQIILSDVLIFNIILYNIKKNPIRKIKLKIITHYYYKIYKNIII